MARYHYRSLRNLYESGKDDVTYRNMVMINLKCKETYLQGRKVK